MHTLKDKQQQGSLLGATRPEMPTQPLQTKERPPKKWTLLGCISTDASEDCKENVFGSTRSTSALNREERNLRETSLRLIPLRGDEFIKSHYDYPNPLN